MAKKEGDQGQGGQTQQSARSETGEVEVTARVPNAEPPREVSVKYNFGRNLAEAVQLFGEDVVFNRFESAATIDLQALMRRHMVDQTNKKGEVSSPAKSDDEIRKLVANWRPGIKQIQRKSAKDKVKDLLSSMSPEERAALLQSYQEGEGASA